MANAAFFDMDGTIIDSRADLCAAVNHTRRDLSLPELPMDEVLRHVGLGARHLLACAINERSGEIDTLWRMFMDRYAEHALESVCLYPGVRETLERLAGKGWLLGINTAKPSFATRAILEKFGIADLFRGAIVAGGDCKEMKPSPLPLIECAAKMPGHAVGPGDWMVGDNWTDLDCGAAAGVKTAFCAYGFGMLRDSVFTAKVECFGELEPLLGQA